MPTLESRAPETTLNPGKSRLPWKKAAAVTVVTIVRDDVEKHDIIVPCCDHERYERDYGLPDHGHCLGNLRQALHLLGETFDLRGEMAWNVFMHNRVTEEGAVVTDPAAHPAGATITLRAERDLVVLLSSCPQDLTPCNDFNPTPMQLVVRADEGGA